MHREMAVTRTLLDPFTGKECGGCEDTLCVLFSRTTQRNISCSSAFYVQKYYTDAVLLAGQSDLPLRRRAGMGEK